MRIATKTVLLLNIYVGKFFVTSQNYCLERNGTIDDEKNNRTKHRKLFEVIYVKTSKVPPVIEPNTSLIEFRISYFVFIHKE